MPTTNLRDVSPSPRLNAPSSSAAQPRVGLQGAASNLFEEDLLETPAVSARVYVTNGASSARSWSDRFWSAYDFIARLVSSANYWTRRGLQKLVLALKTLGTAMGRLLGLAERSREETDAARFVESTSLSDQIRNQAARISELVETSVRLNETIDQALQRMPTLSPADRAAFIAARQRVDEAEERVINESRENLRLLEERLNKRRVHRSATEG